MSVLSKVNANLAGKLVIPDNITSIGYRASEYCYRLTGITIPDSVTSIGECAFANCSGLTSVTIPNSVTSIGVSAFSECSSLTSVTIPDSVTSIGRSAFSGCYKLVEVYNLSSLTITKGSGENGNVGYYALVVHTSAKESSNVFTDANDYIFYENGDTCYLLGYTGKDTVLTLPANCNRKNYGIYQRAFLGCESLTSITIPSGVTSIGNRAFYGCKSLTSITIPDSVTSIEHGAFYACALEDVYYIGPKSSWIHISIDDSNTELTNATIHCIGITESYNNVETRTESNSKGTTLYITTNSGTN